MFTGFKHLHTLFVALFLISVVIKLILLFTKPTTFDKFRAKTRVPEMIATIVFLLTGIAMIIMKEGQFHTLFWIKIALIFAAIPLTIVGFKKKAKIPSLLGAFLFIMIYGVAEMASKKAPIQKVNVAANITGSEEHGFELYKANCVLCHGEAGDKKMAGASDLSISTISKEEVISIIKNGKGNMPKFSFLQAEELEALQQYLNSLKK